MIWQDFVFTGGTAIFCLGLLKAIRNRQPPPPWTCGSHTATIVAFAVAHASNGYWMSTALTLLCAIEWAVLWWQSVRKK